MLCENLSYIIIQQPDYRNNGQFQFIVEYTGGGNPGCVHLSREEWVSRLTRIIGPGELIERDSIFYWACSTDIEIKYFREIVSRIEPGIYHMTRKRSGESEIVQISQVDEVPESLALSGELPHQNKVVHWFNSVAVGSLEHLLWKGYEFQRYQ